MKISIAMATFNGEKYLKEQLESIVNQSLKPDELIISDDCSSDRTKEVINVFARTAPFRVRYLENEKNLGYSQNFNIALIETTGDLIFMSDQDDYWFPEKIETMVNLGNQYPEYDVYMCDAEMADINLNPLGFTKYKQMKSRGYSDSNFVMGCVTMIRGEYLRKILPVPHTINGHDAWIVRLSDALGKKYIYQKPLQYYRRHGDNVSQARFNSTKPITPISQFSEKMLKVKNIFDPDRLKNRMLTDEAYIHGIEKIRDSFSGSDSYKLNKFYQEKLKIYNFNIERQSVRNLSILQRFARVHKLYHSGEYLKVSGIKSALRDLMG